MEEKKYERKNRFNGESVMLTATEAMIHDRIFKYELQATMEDQDLGTGASKYWKKMRKDLSWFMKNNASFVKFNALMDIQMADYVILK